MLSYKQVQGDSLARGPKLLSIKNYVNQLTDDELTTGCYQQNVQHVTLQMLAREKLKVFFKTELSQKNLWPPRSPDLTPADYFLWGLLKGKVYKNTPRTVEHTQRRYTTRDSSRQR